jgi:hypothetical protein
VYALSRRPESLRFVVSAEPFHEAIRRFHQRLHEVGALFVREESPDAADEQADAAEDV